MLHVFYVPNPHHSRQNAHRVILLAAASCSSSYRMNILTVFSNCLPYRNVFGGLSQFQSSAISDNAILIPIDKPFKNICIVIRDSRYDLLFAQTHGKSIRVEIFFNAIFVQLSLCYHNEMQQFIFSRLLYHELTLVVLMWTRKRQRL